MKKILYLVIILYNMFIMGKSETELKGSTLKQLLIVKVQQEHTKILEYALQIRTEKPNQSYHQTLQRAKERALTRIDDYFVQLLPIYFPQASAIHDKGWRNFCINWQFSSISQNEVDQTNAKIQSYTWLFNATAKAGHVQSAKTRECIC